MIICMTGNAGDTGAAALASENRELLLKKFSKAFLDDVQKCVDICDPPKDAIFVRIEEGGVYRALWRLGETLACGLEAVSADIPVKQESIEVCEALDKNPYELPSGGFVFVIPDGERPAKGKIIGRTRNDNDRIIILKNIIRYINK